MQREGVPQPGELATLVLPAGRIAALSLLTSPDVRLPALSGVVKSDPGLAIILLRAANSAASSSRRRIVDPGEAVVRVGLNQTKRLVAAAVVGGALSPLMGCGLDLDAFWAYSLASAIATEDEADTTVLRSGAFAVGLLHDLGRLALAASDPRSYSRLTTQARGEHLVLAAERLMFGEDHAVASGRLLLSVGVPDELVEMVTSHHLAGADQDSPLMRARRVVAAAGFSDGLPPHFDADSGQGVDLQRASALQDHVDWYRSALHSSDREGRIQAAPSPDFAEASASPVAESEASDRQTTIANRRAVFRADARAQASLYTIVGSRLGAAYGGIICNVSLEGAGITSPNSRLFPGDRLAVGFALSGERYWLTSEVRWDQSRGANRGQQLGVMFDAISGHDQRRLWAQISEAERTNRPIGAPLVPAAAAQPRSLVQDRFARLA